MYGKVHNNITYNGLQAIAADGVNDTIKIDGNQIVTLKSSDALVFELNDEENSIDFKIDRSEKGDIVTKNMIENVVKFEDVGLTEGKEENSPLLSNGQLRFGKNIYRIANFDDYLKSDVIGLTLDDNSKISELSINSADDSAEVVLLKNLKKEIENLQFNVNTNTTTNLITAINLLWNL